ncbi:hypothetical protein ACWDYH_35855 [Nocardia goodfellowii]
MLIDTNTKPPSPASERTVRGRRPGAWPSSSGLRLAAVPLILCAALSAPGATAAADPPQPVFLYNVTGGCMQARLDPRDEQAGLDLAVCDDNNDKQKWISQDKKWKNVGISTNVVQRCLYARAYETFVGMEVCKKASPVTLREVPGTYYMMRANDPSGGPCLASVRSGVYAKSCKASDEAQWWYFKKELNGAEKEPKR